MTNATHDSGLDPSAVKGIVGTIGEIQIGSEDSVVITYQCQYSDFGGCICLHGKMPFVENIPKNLMVMELQVGH